MSIRLFLISAFLLSVSSRRLVPQPPAHPKAVWLRAVEHGRDNVLLAVERIDPFTPNAFDEIELAAAILSTQEPFLVWRLLQKNLILVFKYHPKRFYPYTGVDPGTIQVCQLLDADIANYLSDVERIEGHSRGRHNIYYNDCKSTDDRSGEVWKVLGEQSSAAVNQFVKSLGWGSFQFKPSHLKEKKEKEGKGKEKTALLDQVD